MGLRPTHLGYAYQDLLTAFSLVDLMLGRATAVTVDTKAFTDDLFDDVTSELTDGGRHRLQIKHSAHARTLTADSFTTGRRGLQLAAVVASVAEDLRTHPGTRHRIVLRDAEPQDANLCAVLPRVDAGADPGPALHGLSSIRLRFDAGSLLTNDPWRSVLAEIDEDVLCRACDALIVDVGLPACSLDIRNPGPAEQALLRRVADELGAGRPPNRHRTPEDVALALIEAAKAARSTAGTVVARDLAPRLDLVVDFGAVHEGHPVDETVAITRSSLLGTVVGAIEERARTGGTVVLDGSPGAGKSWLCEQLADRLQNMGWLVARHHCWLGATDTRRDERVLTDVVIGSLLRQLATAAPDAVAAVRPRFAATRETLAATVAAARRTEADQPVLLIVDGLDHVARMVGRTDGAAFCAPQDPARVLVDELAQLELPAGVVLLLASQPGDHLAAVVGVPLTVPPLTQNEVRDLAQRLGLLAAFGADVDRGGPVARSDTAVDLVHTRSRGNALYATYLCRQAVGPVAGLDDGPPAVSAVDALDRLRQVPATAGDLDGYYRYLVDGLSEGQQAAVTLLAVCDFAVTPGELREIFPLAALLIPSALTTVAPTIVQQPGLGGLRIHHESFSRFVRAQADTAGVAEVRVAAAAWLGKRGFFVDARAFRHLPELLLALGRHADLSALVGPDFLAQAIAGLQPITAISHVLDVTARSSADRHDWPALVRCVELRRAAGTYEDEGMPGPVAEHADVLVTLLGAGAVAASLLYDGLPTVPRRWGLLLCAAADAAGTAAPWDSYLDTDEDAKDGGDQLGADQDHDLHLAVQRGRLRLRRAGTAAPRTGDGDSAASGPPAAQLAEHLAQNGLPPLRRVLDVLVDGLGAAPLLEAGRLLGEPARRAEVFLHLADIAGAGRHDLPSPRTLAAEAWRCSPGSDPLRMLRHGVPAHDLAAVVLGPDVDAALHETTVEVLQEHVADRPDVVRRWHARVALAREVDPPSLTRLIAQLEGVGFYRAWLRFTVATAGLRRDVDGGTTTPDNASAAVRVALARLAESAQPFTGRPRACDLMSLHGLVQDVLQEAIAVLTTADLEPALASLNVISSGTTTVSNFGIPPSGPLITTDLLGILSRTVGRTDAAVLHRLAAQLRGAAVVDEQPYPMLAGFELEMARISSAAGDHREALLCWQRAARYLSCYGSHKDATIYALLDSLPDLAAADPDQARHRLARVRRLSYLVRKHTNGRGTSGVAVDWWGRLADLDPDAAAVLAAQTLLAEPGLEDGRADAAHHRLLHGQAATADPVVLAALRIAAGPGGRHVAGDVALLGRLDALPADDPARAAGVLPVLANAITATYDDRPLMHSSDTEGPEPTAALRAAAHRLGGDGPSLLPRPPRPDRSTSWTSPTAPKLAQILHARQRPMLALGAPGAVDAVRDYASKPYEDDPAAPRWDTDALIDAVGWRLLQTALDHGESAALGLLHRVVEELRAPSDTPVLADLAAGLDLRRAAAPTLTRLAAVASSLAFTGPRGGWRDAGDGRRSHLWRRAVASSSDAAASVLANQVLAAVAGRSYETYGVTRAVVSAFAAQALDPTDTRGDSAFACWDAAFEVIAYRLPGTTPYDDAESYEPTTAPACRSITDVALARLALATVAMPVRADRRRALVAAAVLFAARPVVARAAIMEVLAADLGAGPLTWLLTVAHDGIGDTGVPDDLAARLTELTRSELLSVRALAAAVLARAGRPVPAPPATAAHPLLERAVADALSGRPN